MTALKIFAVVAAVGVSTVVCVLGAVMLGAWSDAPRHEPNVGDE